MAIFHLQAKVIGRSQGRSVIAAAAYRAAEALHDGELGRSFNYLAKPGVIHSEILLPAGAPARWLDRETLWNEVAARDPASQDETRRVPDDPDAPKRQQRREKQLAREIELALPRELSRTEAIALARDFVREQFVARGMVADLNLHWGQSADGEAQPHAHVMLTLRRVAPGAEGRSEEAGFGLKERGWNDRALLRSWRVRWAELVNERLAEAGLDARIDHRSNAARGIDLEPQNKIGPAGARRAVRGEQAERADEHRDIARRNGERLLAQPELALQALTQQQSTFTRQDLARLIHRHSDGAAQFAAIMTKVEASPELVRVGQDGRGRVRFSTREMVAVERRMEATALSLSVRTTHAVAVARRRAALAGTSLGREQQLAFGHVTRSRDLAVVVGYAGTGKSTMLNVAREAWEAQGYRVRGAALSGIAAEGLEAGAGIASRTIASWEHAWAQGFETLGPRDVMVVDEAGMIGSRQMERVLAVAQSTGAKLVLVGDHEQLQAIEAGAAFRAIVERVGAVELTEVHRQQTAWQREATRELATGRTQAALDRYAAAGMVHAHATDEAAEREVVAGWQDGRRRAPGESRIMLTYTRDGVRRMNDHARVLRRAAGELGDDHILPTALGARAFAAGDRIYFLRNERGLGGPGGTAVKNGTLGTITAIDGDGAGSRLTVRLDREDRATGAAAVVTFGLAAYADIDHGYAATLHKAQSVTVDRAHVLVAPGMDRHLAYVALSRHRHGVALHWSRESFASPDGLATRLGRERAKDTTLDYGESGAELCAAYAERRGLHPVAATGAIVVDGPPRPPLDLAAVRAGLAAQPGRVRRNLERRQVAELRSGVAALLQASAGWQVATQAIAAWVKRRAEVPLLKPLPALPAHPDQPITAAEIDAVVAADATVQVIRRNVRGTIDRAYRDPATAQRRFDALIQRSEHIDAVVAALKERGPELLGKLCGSEGLFASPDAAVKRYLARESAERMIGELVALDHAAARISGAYVETEKRRRRAEAVDVPGLSVSAMRAAASLEKAGAIPGWQSQPPWEPFRPRADDIARAAAVAPVWAAVTKDPGLHDELRRFMEATRLRFADNHPLPPASAGYPVGRVQMMSSLLYSAKALYENNARFQAYAAAEPERQAQAERLAEQKAEAQRQEAARQEAAARATAESEARFKAWRESRHERPRPRPSGPSMG
jgi:Ti-type conjugative transfer relaxase TraA